MSKNDFLEGRNFTSLKVVSSLGGHHEKIGTGLFVRSAMSPDGKKEAVFLVVNKSILSHWVNKLTLNFYEQESFGSLFGPEKKFSYDIEYHNKYTVTHTNPEVDLACVKVCECVNKKYLRGVNPHFDISDESLKLEVPSSSLLGNAAFFTESRVSNPHVSNRSEQSIKPIICHEYITALTSVSVDGTLQFVAHNKSHTVMAGSPIFHRVQDGLRLVGVVTGPTSVTTAPSGRDSQKPASVIGVQAIRELVDLAKEGLR